MAMASRHVLIIGGGLAGPCLALSLARRNIRSTIFEIRPQPSESGGSISLGPNALQVLDRYAGVYYQLRANGFVYNRFGAFTDGGEKLGEISVGEEEKGDEGYPALRIMRSTLHEVLLDAGSKTELVDMRWAARLAKIEENEQGVTAHFEDGTTVTGDILIGADGIHSKVREHILGPEAPTPVFTGTCIVNGFLPASAAITPSPDFTFPAFMFTSSGLFMTIPIDADAKTLAWGITQTSKERTRDEWRDFELSGEAARLAKADFDQIRAQPVRSLLDSADESKAKVWAPYSIPELPRWHTPRVCLIGDAAHALPPNGQGSAMAFEDVAIMTRLITSKEGRSFEQLFERFEAIRRPRIKGIQESSRKGEAMKARTGPVGWYLKKWAFRGFFWWNSGVLKHNKETTYDVEEVDVGGSTPLAQ
ncbi:hypothetical protein IAR55_005983 [Kwoniella newhampshirensis]|uniref:FAD-binding domain-containing protein n=1 Tax=Kwoniella newhampshirensis TaxID=1651941 RepID=A0AAW0YVT7_9TREE